MPVDTILVPTDFSPDAERAIATATELARLYGARIVVVHAHHVVIPVASSPMPAGYALPAGFYEELRAHAKASVDRVAEEIRAQGIEASAIAVFQPASTAIVAQAESLPADLIVMGTRGISGLKHVVFGSVAERVVRAAPCPVMTVKAEN